MKPLNLVVLSLLACKKVLASDFSSNTLDDADEENEPEAVSRRTISLVTINMNDDKEQLLPESHISPSFVLEGESKSKSKSSSSSSSLEPETSGSERRGSFITRAITPRSFPILRNMNQISKMKSAIRNGDDSLLLEYLQRFLNTGRIKRLPEVFDLCARHSKYECLRLLRETGHTLLSKKGNNIFHYAAIVDDAKLIEGFSVDLLKEKNINGNFPMELVQNQEIAVLFNELGRNIVPESTSDESFRLEFLHKMSHMANRFEIKDHSLYGRFDLYHSNLIRGTDTEKSREMTVITYRDSVLRNAFEYAHDDLNMWFRPNTQFSVKFIGERSASVKEWLAILIDAMFQTAAIDPTGTAKDFSLPMFEIVDEDSQLYVPNLLYDEDVFRIVGSIFAMALNNRVPIKYPLIPAIYRRLLGHWKYSEADLLHQHPKMHESFMEDLKNESLSRATLNQNLKRNIFYLYGKYQKSINAFVEGFNKMTTSSCKLNEFFTLYEIPAVLASLEEEESSDREYENSEIN